MSLKNFSAKLFFYFFLCLISLLQLSGQLNGQTRKFIYKSNLTSEIFHYRTNFPVGNKITYVEGYLPKNFTRKGTVDYTVYIQQAFNSGGIVIMPNFPLLINSKGLDIGSNRVIYFQKNSSLIMATNSLENYYALRVADKNNVKIINPKLIGDRDGHKGNKGEWGMGISLMGATNVEIINPSISKFWGDGIYIGRGTKTFCEDVIIKGGSLDFNRRNGISVISVKGLRIENVLISNTFGTAPMAALDFEPNKEDEILQDITVDGIKTFNNHSYEILFVFWKLKSKSSPIYLTIRNHQFDSIKQPITIYANYKGENKKIGGRISYENSNWNNNNLVNFQEMFKKHNAVTLEIENVRINNINKNVSFKP